MFSRREFLKTASLASLSVMTLPELGRAMQLKEKNIGLELYTVREQLKNDLPGTLKKVSDIGYIWLEAAGYEDGRFYGYTPKELKMIAGDLNLRFISSHVSFTPGETTRVIDAHAELGAIYIVIPSLPPDERNSEDSYKAAAERMNETGIFCRMAEMRLGYHNHDYEFQKLRKNTGYEILLMETDPNLVCFELDFYWMIKAGHDPIDYIRRFRGRFELWHIKDMAYGKEKGFTEVGKGRIMFQKYFDVRGAAGLKYFFVEQDQCKRDPMESIAISYKYLDEQIYFD